MNKGVVIRVRRLCEEIHEYNETWRFDLLVNKLRFKYGKMEISLDKIAFIELAVEGQI